MLGCYSVGQVSDPRDLIPYLASHQGHEPWLLCAFGAAEHACVTAAAAMGGHVRVGFENNLYLHNGDTAPDNAALVAQAARAAASLGRPLATPADIRSMYQVA